MTPATQTARNRAVSCNNFIMLKGLQIARQYNANHSRKGFITQGCATPHVKHTPVSNVNAAVASQIAARTRTALRTMTSSRDASTEASHYTLLDTNINVHVRQMEDKILV